MSTERFGFCVLAYEGGDIVTRAHGDLSDRVGKPCGNGQPCAIEPECRMIGLHMYDGLFKVIPGKLRSSDDAFNIRLGGSRCTTRAIRRNSAPHSSDAQSRHSQADVAFLHVTKADARAARHEDTAGSST